MLNIVILSLVAVVIGYGMLLISSFRRRIWWGLLVLFIPFSWLAYSVVAWDRAQHGFLVIIFSSILGIGALYGGGTAEIQDWLWKHGSDAEVVAAYDVLRFGSYEFEGGVIDPNSAQSGSAALYPPAQGGQDPAALAPLEELNPPPDQGVGRPSEPKESGSRRDPDRLWDEEGEDSGSKEDEAIPIDQYRPFKPAQPPIQTVRYEFVRVSSSRLDEYLGHQARLTTPARRWVGKLTKFDAENELIFIEQRVRLGSIAVSLNLTDITHAEVKVKIGGP